MIDESIDKSKSISIVLFQMLNGFFLLVRLFAPILALKIY